MNVAAWRRAWERVTGEYDALRAGFHWDLEKPIQVVHVDIQIDIREKQWPSVIQGKHDQRLQEFLEAERRRGFELSIPPLVRTVILHEPDGRDTVVITMHHLILDGWSTAIVLKRIWHVYDCLCEGAQYEVNTPPKYGDYIRHITNSAQSDAEPYWRSALGGFTETSRLPFDLGEGSAGAHGTIRCQELVTSIPEGLISLRECARQSHVTPIAILAAAWARTLSKYDPLTTPLFGVATSGRFNDFPGVEAVVGLLTNTLPIRIPAARAKTDHELICLAHSAWTEASKYETTRLSEIRRWLGVAPEHNLFNTVLVFENFPSSNELGNLSRGVRPRAAFSISWSNLPLAVTIGGDKDMTWHLAYDTARFSESQARTILDTACEITCSLLHSYSAVELIQVEKSDRLVTNQDGALGEPTFLTLPVAIEQIAEKFSGRIAVSDHSEKITYGDLNGRANALARRLQEVGIAGETPVAVWTDRSIDFAIGALAVLKAGGYYVPIDPTYPSERILLMVRAVSAKVIVVDSDSKRIAANDLEYINVKDEISAGNSEDNLGVQIHPDQIAYVIFTSGSTGTPKGVAISHLAVMSLFTAFDTQEAITSDDVWSVYHSVGFDFSVWELWGALVHGSQAVFISHYDSRDPSAFLTRLVEHGVTVLSATPTAFRLLTDYISRVGATIPSLRFVIFGGEMLDIRTLGWWKRFPQLKLINMYGITETTVHVTYRLLQRSELGMEARSLIGSPLKHLTAHVLSDDFNPVGPGMIGEMYVGGTGVARGYIGDSAQTADRFLPDSLSGQPGARLYRSGDLIRVLPNGDFEYIGRRDNQAKLRGFRIELGEIERTLETHPAVMHAVTSVKEISGEPSLVAYIIQADAVTAGELQQHAANRLPGHMVPARFCLLDKLPVNQNGKLDRGQLPPPDHILPVGSSDCTPVGAREETLAAIWRQVLGHVQVGRFDNFYALGGDSIKTLRIVSLAAEKGIKLSLRQVLDHQTIAGLAAAVSASSAEGGEASQACLKASPKSEVLAWPMSPLQLALIAYAARDRKAYHDVFMYKVRSGDCDLNVFREVVISAAGRHAVLSSAFNLSALPRPLQVVSECEIPVGYSNLAGLSSSEQERVISEWLDRETVTEFDVTIPPLVRFYIHELGGGCWTLSISFHHAILDGWSVATLVSELLTDFWCRMTTALPAKIVKPALPVADYVEGMSVPLEEAAEFWIAELATAEIASIPMIARRRSAGRRVLAHIVRLPQTVSRAVTQWSKLNTIPLKTVLLAVFHYAVSRITGVKQPIIGMGVNCRPPLADADRVLGLFVNVVPVTIPNATDIREAARAAEKLEARLMPYAGTPLGMVERFLGKRNICNFIFNYVHFHVFDSLKSFPGLVIENFDGREETDFPLTAHFARAVANDDIIIRMQFNANVLDKNVALRLSDTIVEILRGITATSADD
jgi:amino acid adenylation domain-containing protein